MSYEAKLYGKDGKEKVVFTKKDKQEHLDCGWYKEEPWDSENPETVKEEVVKQVDPVKKVVKRSKTKPIKLKKE